MQKYEEKQKIKSGQFTGSTARSHRTKGIPSILLKDTPYNDSFSNRGREPLDRLENNTKGSLQNKRLKTGASVVDDEQYTQYNDDGEVNQKKLDISKLSLDEYLRRYTSEDNASFQQIHDKDREDFFKKISWMFNENEKYQKLNQLAIESGRVNDNQSKLVITNAENIGKTNTTNSRTVPALQMWNHDPQSSLFFRKPEEDLAISHEHQLALKELNDSIGPPKQIKKQNTRLPSEFMVKFNEQNQTLKGQQSQQNLHARRDSEFERPLNREKLNGVFEKPIQQKPQQTKQYDLGSLMAINRGLDVQKRAEEPTPMVKGFKMVRATPKREVEESPMITWGKIEGEPLFLGIADSDKGRGYQVPQSPAREELSLKMANKSQIKKREEKALQKQQYDAKLGLTPYMRQQNQKSGQTPQNNKKSLSDAGQRLLQSIVREKSALRPQSSQFGNKMTPIRKA